MLGPRTISLRVVSGCVTIRNPETALGPTISERVFIYLDRSCQNLEVTAPPASSKLVHKLLSERRLRGGHGRGAYNP